MWVSLTICCTIVAVCIIWGVRVFLTAHRSSKRIKRMNQLQAIVCSTEYTSEQRRAAMEELLDMGLGHR